MTTAKYTYPPIYNFPPFFTFQRNPATYSSQLKLWTRFVLDYCQFHRVFSLNIDAAWEKSGAGGLFKNETINRELNTDAKREILKALVEEGNAAWDPPIKGKSKSTEARSKVFVYWKKPEEWGELIYNWVVNTGQNGTIMTFFELTQGDLISGTEFGALPIPILRLALSSLERQGKAKVFEGSESGDSMAGVKFS